MGFFNRLAERLRDDISVQGLIRLVLILTAVFLLQHTWGFIRSIYMTVWNVIRPFFIGFVLAYILHKPIPWFEKRGIPAKASVPLLYLVVAGLFVWLLSTLIPMLVSRTSDLLNTMISSIRWLREVLVNSYDGPGGTWISTIAETSLDALIDFKALIPSVTSALPDLLSGTFSVLINGLIAVIISIFMCFEWDKIRFHTVLLTIRVSKRFYQCVFAINKDFTEYLGSMIILMAIRFAEYSLLYLLCGHPDWLILGVASSLSLIIPYVGPTAVNTIGILSALHLPMFKVILLVAMIVILSQIDEYVITPMVHSHNLKLSPLWILFSIFAASSLFGVGGFIFAVPMYLVFRVIFRMYLSPGADQDMEKELTV